MTFSARKLITNAYYLSGVVSPDFQVVSGPQITRGHDILNSALSKEGITGALIPYYKGIFLTFITGVEVYNIPTLIEVETLTFNIGPVRYSMSGNKGRRQYFGSPRQNNIKSLPYEWHAERVKGGTDIYVYFLPNTNYPIEIWGKFMLDEVNDICVDLLTYYDRFYLDYLTYALAKDICHSYQTTLPPETAKELASLEAKLTFVSPMDLTNKKRSSLGRQDTINYGYANLGTGWLPT